MYNNKQDIAYCGVSQKIIAGHALIGKYCVTMNLLMQNFAEIYRKEPAFVVDLSQNGTFER